MSVSRNVAIIPTRDRPDDFNDCVQAIRPQVDAVVAVTHGQEAYHYARGLADITVPYADEVPNISQMWRSGMDATPWAEWYAVLNDDCVVAPGWFNTLRAAAESAGAAGASGWRAETTPKIAGFAFILDANSGVRPDERLRWWYSDDAIQKRCEAHSGFTLVKGVTTDHRRPNQSTVGVLQRISRYDRRVYRRAYKKGMTA